MPSDDLHLEENDTIDEVESSNDSDLEVIEAPVIDEEPYFWGGLTFGTGSYLRLGGLRSQRGPDRTRHKPGVRPLCAVLRSGTAIDDDAALFPTIVDLVSLVPSIAR